MIRPNILTLLGVAVLLLTISSCATSLPSQLCIPCDPLATEECVLFRAVSFVPDGADKPIGDAPVFLSSPGRLLFLGQTAPSGDFLVARSHLLSQRQPAQLLFCWDHTSLACTSVRLDLPDIGRWDAFNVTLPVNPLGPPKTVATPGLVPPVKLP